MSFIHEPSPLVSSFTPAPAAHVYRCACGGSASGGGECESCRAKRLQRQATSEPGEPLEAPGTVSEALNGPGQPLDPPVRAFMEARLGHDFGRVRIHAGQRAAESARAVHAHAYAVGQHIVFDNGRFQPNSQTGRELLAHELAHVAQGEGAARPEAAPLRVVQSSRHESEAETAARAVRPGVETNIVRPSSDPVEAHGAVRLRPNVEFGGGINLLIDETGHVTVTVSGPELPVVGNPAIGIRRNNDGTYQIVAGGKGKIVAPGDIPALLRNAVSGTGKPGQASALSGFRLPTCEQLSAPDGTRTMTFDEYKVSQMLSSSLLPITAPLYEAIVAVCRPKPKEVEPPQPPNVGDFPQRSLPENVEMA